MKKAPGRALSSSVEVGCSYYKGNGSTGVALYLQVRRLDLAFKYPCRSGCACHRLFSRGSNHWNASFFLFFARTGQTGRPPVPVHGTGFACASHHIVEAVLGRACATRWLIGSSFPTPPRAGTG